MEQQPVRRRRRRRSSKARRESLAWLAYVISLARRAYSWVGLVAILAVILTLGLGVPVTVLDSVLSFWKHW
jgi:hypothetical protein